MSWDITIQRFSRFYTSIQQIPNDERCAPLGSQIEVRTAISQVFLGTNWSDPAWGTYDFAGGSIEFNMGKSEPNDGFMLHVRASQQVVPLIVALCRQNGWQALDCGSGEFLEQSNEPQAGLEAWAAYRNQVLGNA
jgi:hypothetical protein